MSTELTTTQIRQGLSTVRSVLAPDLNDDELTLFAMVANRSGLDPFAKQIYAVKRTGAGGPRVTFQTGIDGYRSIAARTGLYDGQDEPEFAGPCSCSDAPQGHPETATVRVYRKGVGRPIAATAFWHEYKPAPGRSGDGDVMWRRMPHVMLGKVAEALALRKAFPYDPTRGTGIGDDIYTPEEMDQADGAEVPVAARPVTTRERIAARREAIAPPEPVRSAPHEDGPEITEEYIDAVATEVIDAEIVDPTPEPMTRADFTASAVASHVSKADVAAARERLGIAADDQSDDAYGRLADFLGVR